MKSRTKFSWESYRFFHERQLLDRLEELLQAPLLEPIFEKCRYPEEKDYWKSLFEGQSFRLSKNLAPEYYQICQEVLEVLQFEEPVEFFITSDPSVNAAAYLRESSHHSHLIVFNSGLVENFSPMEFRFVLGHELGHIIFKAAQLRRLIENIFPEDGSIPLALENLIRLWDKFAEISADRMGFIAAPDLKSCLSAFFKLSSGLSINRINFNLENYLKEVDESLQNLSPDQAMFYASHPANPIRIKAIQLFMESKLYAGFLEKKEVVIDAELHDKMEELCQMMELHPDNPRDHYRLVVIATGGLVMARIDGRIAPEEEETILNFISRFTVYPREFLTKISSSHKNLQELQEDFLISLRKLLEIDPGERYSVFDFLCHIALADRKLKKSEIDFLMNLAQTELGMHELEASREFVASMQRIHFLPRV